MSEVEVEIKRSGAQEMKMKKSHGNFAGPGQRAITLTIVKFVTTMPTNALLNIRLTLARKPFKVLRINMVLKLLAVQPRS